ncbi:MAG: hypothetical protein K2R93_12240 [Gemmatimonadaceae bacterium]|nr:hypothetical protein [Gemmatimonadaceae bacterium]
MKLYLFDKWEGARSFSRDERGLVTTTCEDDSLPEAMASDSPVGALCVWEGTIYDPRKLTDDELDELGISPEAARECDEWWQGKMRPATDAEILAVLSFAPNTHTPAPSVATPDVVLPCSQCGGRGYVKVIDRSGGYALPTSMACMCEAGQAIVGRLPDTATPDARRVVELNEWRVTYANGNQGFPRTTREEAQQIADDDNANFPGCGARVVRVALIEEASA